jgi:hypothetical protein
MQAGADAIQKEAKKGGQCLMAPFFKSFADTKP